MARRRATISEMMAVVALAAVDRLVIPVADHLAGCLTIGFALQVGLLLAIRGRGRGRRFWSGFESIGWALVLGFLAIRRVGQATINRWPLYLFDTPYSFIDIHGELKIYEVVIVFELAYGLPMLLLALAGGLSMAAAPEEPLRDAIEVHVRGLKGGGPPAPEPSNLADDREVDA